MPRVQAHGAAVRVGSAAVMALPAEHF